MVEKIITNEREATRQPSRLVLYSISAQVRFEPLALRAMLDQYRAAEEQSAAFAPIGELLDANALDYRAARSECVAGQGQQFFIKSLKVKSENRE